ncbi:MAG: hypothetical protein AB4062_09650 [Crocosphaera sp.]
MALSAFVQGMLGASSLALGATVGVFLTPKRSISASIMAFGSGTLIAAIAFEIAPKVYEEAGFFPLMLGFAIGGVLFTNLSQYIDQHGGFLRKPAASRRYLFERMGSMGVPLTSRIPAVLTQGFSKDSASLLFIGTAQAVAGGAILAMLASTMMPEAYELGGSSVSYSTIAGFLLGFLIAMLSG